MLVPESPEKSKKRGIAGHMVSWALNNLGTSRQTPRLSSDKMKHSKLCQKWGFQKHLSLDHGSDCSSFWSCVNHIISPKKHKGPCPLNLWFLACPSSGFPVQLLEAVPVCCQVGELTAPSSLCRTMGEESFIHLEADFCHNKVFAFLIILVCLAGLKSKWQLKFCLVNVTWGMEHFGVMEGVMILFSWTLETCDVLDRRPSYHWASWNSSLYQEKSRASVLLTLFERNNTFRTQFVLCCMNIFVPFKSIVF